MNQAVEKSTGSCGSIIKSTVGNRNDVAANGASKIGPRGTYSGHADTVEDVAFCPFSAQEFCSVGDDSCLILWDARVGSNPIHKVEKAHDADFHCVDWNPHDSNLILTRSADNSIHMFDRRKLASDGSGFPVHSRVIRLPYFVCRSFAEDGLLNICDYDRVMHSLFDALIESAYAPSSLFFQHADHRDKVIDFHWNMYDPWTVLSVSDDCDSIGGGGTLQIWRMSDIVYRPEEEVLAELEKFKSHVLECSKG